MVTRGGWFLLLFMLVMSAADLGWISLYHEENPALSVAGRPRIQIYLEGTGSRLDGFHQFNDVYEILSVIKLAKMELSDALESKLIDTGFVLNGKSLKFQLVGDAVVNVDVGIMPAALRISLGIPLRVTEMSLADWEDLPGIGPALALRIEHDRQKNGDILSLDDLERIQGVGKKRILAWRTFFIDD